MSERDKDRDAVKKRREREREIETEREEYKSRTAKTPQAGTGPSAEREWNTLLTQARTDVERVHALVRQYISGAARAAPVSERKKLEDLLKSLQTKGDLPIATQFKLQAILKTYATYRELWDRWYKGLEK